MEHVLKRLGAGFALLAGLLSVINVAQAQGRSPLSSLEAAVKSLQAAVECLNLPTVIVNVPLLARGTYSVTGGAIGGGISLVGRPNGLGPYRNYFVFDLSVLGDKDLVLGAQLITYNPPGGFLSDSTDTLTFVLNRVSTSDKALMNGSAGTLGYLDLADGPVYGTYVASSAVNGSQITIALSDKAIRDIYRSRHNGFSDAFEPYLFALGGSIAELNMGVGIAGNAYFLAFGDTLPLTNTALELNVKHYSDGCPPPTSTQYQ